MNRHLSPNAGDEEHIQKLVARTERILLNHLRPRQGRVRFFERNAPPTQFMESSRKKTLKPIEFFRYSRVRWTATISSRVVCRELNADTICDNFAQSSRRRRYILHTRGTSESIGCFHFRKNEEIHHAWTVCLVRCCQWGVSRNKNTESV